MNKILVSLIICFSFISLNAQDFSALESDLAFYNDVMSNAFEYEHKAKAGEIFNQKFSEALNTEGSFEYPFQDLKWISNKTAENSSFRLFTWFVEVEENIFKNYGLIQFADGEIVNLTDMSDNMTDVEYEEQDKDYWYGALYYKMMAQEYKGENIYLLYGYNPGDAKNKMKVLDVLSFNGKTPIFGKEIFKEVDSEKRTLYKSRLLLTYSGKSNVNLNYNENLELIMFDNLVSTVTPDQGPTNLPDGSYKAYKKDGEEWLYVEKVFDLISDTPPTDGRSGKQKGLFKTKRNKKE
jgi:hypothetical protein